MPVLLVLKPRTRLRKFLEGQLELMEKNGSTQGSVLKALLRQAVEGLGALDYGESHRCSCQALEMAHTMAPDRTLSESFKCRRSDMPISSSQISTRETMPQFALSLVLINRVVTHSEAGERANV